MTYKRLLLLLSIAVFAANSAELKIKQELSALVEQMEILQTSYKEDLTNLRKEIAELKSTQPTTNHERNEQATLKWARTSMQEIRAEVKELADNVNNSELLRQLHFIRNELKQALSETTDLAQLARTQEARVDKLDNEVGSLRHEDQQTRTMLAEVRSHLGKLAKEIKAKQLEEMNNDSYNEVVEVHELRHGAHRARVETPHRMRHSKMIHSQISRLSRSQDQLDEYQQTLQIQILDVQRRLDRCEEPNWNLLSAKVDFLELENKGIREELKNITVKASDFDKVHSSMLELREDLESVENKADKTVPEFRKEISKLEVNIAQLNAQSSYLKEDQDHLRQSVKAIAVSISNAIDRAELDRLLLKKINDSIEDLQTRTKTHSHRLNDHILKSEANHQVISNLTENMPLPELMGEVKELQPVEEEYENLISQLPKDCNMVDGPPGTYLIHPGKSPLDAWCVNGSTLLQRRLNGSVEFNRKFQEYVHSFGNPAGEYWLGLEAMHILTADNCSSMRIDMTDIYGGTWYAQYEHFLVGGPEDGYVLNVSGFSGNASDAFEYQNHMPFSAIDRDRDISNTHCAANYEGGWWFSHCQHVNINGKYSLGLTWFDSARNEWIAVASSEMRIYRRRGCS